MKKFHQLTKEEKAKAIKFARATLDAEVAKGHIDFGREVSEAWMNQIAIEVAEGSQYTESGEADMYLPTDEDLGIEE